MKKILRLLSVLTLCALLLGACGSKEGAGAPDGSAQGSAAAPATALPQEGDHGQTDQSQSLEAMPTLEPVEPLTAGDDSGYFDIDALLNRSIEAAGDDPAALEPSAQPNAVASGGSGADTSTYQYSALTDTALGFTFNYPSHWVNVPGVYTICFREPAEDGEFPARVAITVKNLVHTPDEQVMTEQMTAYMRIIHKQYDNATFESGTPNLQDSFLGKQAMSNTYLAFSGDTEVKGFVIGAAAGRTMCVFHFCASYEDYVAMEGMMRYMLNSVQVVSSDK